ncbi:hypothetical protein D3C78_18640 [compost metagenome]
MMELSFRNKFSVDQSNVIESWINHKINKYSDVPGCIIRFQASANHLTLRYEPNNRRTFRLVAFISKNIHYMLSNKAESYFIKGEDDWICKFIEAKIPLPQTLQRMHDSMLIELEILRSKAKRALQLKKTESLITMALAKQPFNEDLLTMYSKTKRGYNLSFEEILSLRDVLDQSVSENNPAAAKPDLERLEAVMNFTGERTTGMMKLFKKQLHNGNPLTNDQAKVLSSWEHMYCQAV